MLLIVKFKFIKNDTYIISLDIHTHRPSIGIYNNFRYIYILYIIIFKS